MGDALQELEFHALKLATAARDRAERRDFRPDSVHATRVGGKRLRALWQLLRPVLEQDVTGAANARLREANRALATARDAHVAHKTIDKLVKQCKRGKDRKALRALRETFHEDPEPRVPHGAEEIAAVYRREAVAWRSLRLDAPAQAVIYSGIRRAYRRNRKLAKKAIASGEPAAYHAWRKWVKYLLYQLEALEPRLLDWQRDHLEGLERLGDALGKHNDLQNLRKSLSSRDLPRKVCERAATRIDKRAQRLRRRCHKLQRDVYRLRPEDFALSIARAVSAPERIPAALVSMAGD